jgi:class 3 adenylate cyclase
MGATLIDRYRGGDGRKVDESRRVAAAGAVVVGGRVRAPAPPAVVSIAEPGAASTVGRAAEVALVVRWLVLAAEGTPRIGIVHGPAGVGKSHLLRIAANEAQARGFRALRASGFDGNPPLLPVLTALAPLIDDARRGRRHDLTAEEIDSLDHLARSPPRDLTGTTQPRAGDPSTYLTVTRLLIGATAARPVFLAIDDADALDDASATLLAHVASAAVDRSEDLPVPLVTVFATRGGGQPTVSRALDRLRDEPGCAELRLQNLDEVGLNELLTSLGPATPARPLLQEIRFRTGGNPLHARLLWAHLVETGTAVVRDGHVIPHEPGAATAGHLGLEDVIDVRLEALSSTCRDVLQVASVLGPIGDIATVAEAAGRTPAAVEAAFVEAREAGVCDADEARYRFGHPLLATALSRSLTSTQRRHLHVAFSSVLARAASPSPLDVASHLQAARDLAPVDDRRRWGVAAAEKAAELGAWGDAVAAYDLALRDGGHEGFDDERLLGVYVGAVTASAADHDLASCERFARPALALAQRLGNLERWCDTVVELAHARVRVVRAGGNAELAEVVEFVERAGDGVPHLRARASAMLAEAHFAAFDFERGLAQARHALALAESAGDDRVLSEVLFAQALQHQGRFELDESDRCFADSIAHGERADAMSTAWALARLPSARWLRGDLVGAEAAALDAEAAASLRSDWAELSLIAAWRAAIAVAAGRFADAVDLAGRALALHRRCDYAFTPVVAQPARAIARAVLGDVAGAHRDLEEWRSVRPSRWIDQLDLLVDALGGERLDQPATPVSSSGDRWDDEPLDLRRASRLCATLEVCAAAAGTAPVEQYRVPLEDLHRRGVRFVPGSLSLVSRLCATAAALAGDAAGATEWWRRARGDAGAARAAGEAARCDLDEGLFLVSRLGGRDVADRLLTDACSAFDRLGMLPFLRRAEAALGAAGVPNDRQRARRVILFTDLVESTSLNAAEGDEVFLQLMRVHDRFVRSSLRRHDGVEFKHTGDGLAAWFRSPRQAVRCALNLQDELTSALHANSRAEVRLRCGLAAGAPIDNNGDIFGLTVATAARICAQAGPGMVLVSDDIAQMVDDKAIRFDARGHVQLKGLPAPTKLLSAHPATY